ncbi:hypothetical protein HOG48_04800 [Candidatus Peregrinibacteria bacterium]|jgi:hypothetical protein|nr:hypothetical protein [Candidatus Peregrinibacteria bacterium]
MTNNSGQLVERFEKNIFLSKEEKDYWIFRIPELTEVQLAKLEGILDGFDSKVEVKINEICKFVSKDELLVKLKTFKKQAKKNLLGVIRKKETAKAEADLEDSLGSI